MLAWWAERTRWAKLAIVAWIVVVAFVSVRAFLSPAKRTVYPIYSASAQLWWSGAEIYEPHRPNHVQTGYRYSPTCAILMTPLALLPDSVGGASWRILSAMAFIGALAWLFRSVFWAADANPFAWLTLLCLPLSIQSLSNGQANLLVIAAMMAAVAATKEGRWNWVAVFLGIAFSFKVYPIVLGMVLLVLYPRPLAGRVGLAIAVSLLAPFLFQHPSYVVDQYGKWLALLSMDNRDASELANRHRDLWLLLELHELPINRTGYMILQMAGGAAVAAVCWARQRQGWPEPALLTSTLALTVAWLLLLGPVVESSTFILLAPSLAWSMITAFKERPLSPPKYFLYASIVCLVAAVLLGGIANTAVFHATELHPMGTLFYFAYLWTERRPQALVETQSVELRAAA